MPKIFILLLSFLSIFVSPAFAEIPTTSSSTSPPGLCQLQTIPSPIVTRPNQDRLWEADTKNNPITFILHVDSGYTYDVYFQRGGFLGTGEVAFKNLVPNSYGDIVFKWTIGGITGDTTKVGTHPIEIVRQGAPGNYCPGLTYEIKKIEEAQQVNCNILGPTEANIETQIKLSGTITPVGKYQFVLPSVNKSTGEFSPDNSGVIPEQNLGILNDGTYLIKLQKKILRYVQKPGGYYEFFEDVKSCNISPITVYKKGDKPNPDTTPTQIGSGQAAGASGQTGSSTGAALKCTGDSCTKAGGEPCANNPDGIQTAIGCIDTKPEALIEDVFKLAVGVGGGIAFLLMVFGAFGMITSAGNPEALKESQQRFVNAIIGILFIVFSTLLLQIIGVDILGIPGFKK